MAMLRAAEGDGSGASEGGAAAEGPSATEQIAAALQGETPAAAETETELAPETEAAALPGKWARLAREQRRAQGQASRLATERAAVDAEKKSIADIRAKAERLDRIEKLRKEDPDAWEREVGIDYGELTNRRLKTGSTEVDTEKAIASELDRREAAKAAEAKEKADAAEKAKAEESAKAAAAEQDAFVSVFVESMDSYPALTAELDRREAKRPGSSRKALLDAASEVGQAMFDAGKRGYKMADVLAALDKQIEEEHTEIASRLAARSPVQPGVAKTPKAVSRPSTLSSRQSAGRSVSAEVDYSTPEAKVAAIAKALGG